MRQKLFLFVVVSVCAAMLAGCASGPIVQIGTPVPGATPPPGSTVEFPAASIQIGAPGPNPNMNSTGAGILLGLWHGIISIVTLVISFVNPNVQMYEVHNDGGPYNLGFLLGMIIMLALLGTGATRGRRG
jgi:hypothetical protein